MAERIPDLVSRAELVRHATRILGPNDVTPLRKPMSAPRLRSGLELRVHAVSFLESRGGKTIAVGLRVIFRQRNKYKEVATAVMSRPLSSGQGRRADGTVIFVAVFSVSESQTCRINTHTHARAHTQKSDGERGQR